MNKVNKVSISGIVFTLDEEAAGILRSYIDTLEAHYRTHSCGSEIMEGIESRIAELLTDRGCRESVVSAAVAREVTEIIGKPEDIYDNTQESGAPHQEKAAPVKKRFYRNPDGKSIGGVCSGIAAYYDIDPVWPRLFFVLLAVAGIVCSDWIDWAGMLAIVPYCVLWAVMPMARTAEQKSQMRGKSLSIDEIEKDAAMGQTASRSSSGSTFLSVCAKILLGFIGVILFFTGFVGICAIACVILGLGVAGLALPEVLQELISSLVGVPEWARVTMNVLALLVTFIPFAALLYGGVKLLFNFKTPKWRPGLVMLLLWLVAVIALLVIGIATVPDILHPLEFV